VGGPDVASVKAEYDATAEQPKLPKENKMQRVQPWKVNVEDFDVISFCDAAQPHQLSREVQDEPEGAPEDASLN
jgi:heat shock protein HspQ